MKLKYTLKKTMLIAALSVSGVGMVMAQSVGGLAGSAAYAPPTPVPVVMLAQAYGTGPSVDASLNPLLNQMNIGINGKLIDIGQYLHGNENLGNGLIELLMSINSKMDQQNAIGNNQGIASDTDARARLLQQQIIQDQLARGAPNPQTGVMQNIEQACEEMTYASGRGGASRGSHAAAKVLAELVDQNIQENHSPANSLGRLFVDHKDNYCSELDVKNGRGCTTVGKFPAADVQASSLTTGATPNGSQPSGNVSFDTDQIKAALSYVRNVTPMIPADPPESVKTTSGGIILLTKLNRYRSRVSQVNEPYMSELSLKAQPGSLEKALGDSSTFNSDLVNTNQLTGTGYGSDGKSGWSSVAPKYQQLFGDDVQFPETPSEWEVLRYDVFSRYADAKDQNSWQAQVGSFTDTQSLQELSRMEALSLRLQWLSITQQQETNRLLSLIATNQLDPQTRSELASDAAQVSDVK